VTGAVDRGVVSALGLHPAAAGVLLGLARERVGRRGLVTRELAFLVAIAPGARRLPAGVRRRAVRALLHALFREPGDLLVYHGQIPTPDAVPLRGLIPVDAGRRD